MILPRDGMMGDRGDAARRLVRWQKVIEYSQAVVVPTVLALMMFSFVVAPSLLGKIMQVAIGASALTIIPAFKAQRLHHLCWAKNTMPKRMIAALMGTIYISLVGVLSVSLFSAHKGLNPLQPMTFAVIAGLLLGLACTLAYRSKNKGRFERMDVRFFNRPASDISSTVASALAEKGEEAEETSKGNKTRLWVGDRNVAIVIASQPLGSTEVVIECAELSGTDICEHVKKRLDEI